ncbi:MAG: hypothetical protein QM601_05415, partial [Pseudoxanthomonas sp.]
MECPQLLRVLFASACLLCAGTLAAQPAGDEWTLTSTTLAADEAGMPYVGNGYFSQRIPPAGAGYLADVGHSYWPLGHARGVQAMLAGLYASGTFSTLYPGQAKRAPALLPTWSTLDFAAPSGAYTAAGLRAADVAGYRQRLDLRSGEVTTSGIWTAPGGERTGFEYRVFTDRARKHVGVVSLRLVPQWDGPLQVTALLDGAGAQRLQPRAAQVDVRAHRQRGGARTA